MKPFPWLLFFGSFLYLALFRLLMLAGWEEPSANLSLFLGVGFAYDLMIAAQFCLILGLVARLAPRWVRAVGLGLGVSGARAAESRLTWVLRDERARLRLHAEGDG